MPAFIVRGHRVRTSSQRRYVVWVGRETATEIDRWNWREQAYETVRVEAQAPTIVARSDNLTTARKRRDALRPRGGYGVVIDTTTGEEV